MLADATPDPTVHASGPTNYDGRDSLDESEMETEPSGGRHSAELSSDDEPLAERTSRRGRLMHREQRRDLDNGFDR